MITVLYFWDIEPSNISKAIARMALDRRALKKNKQIDFFKLLGTGKGDTFTPRDANSLRWGLLVTIKSEDLESFDHGEITNRWRRIASSEYRALLRPLSSHGQWSSREPFTVEEFKWDGPVAAITRARIKWSQNFRFWKAVPPITGALHSAPGLRSAIGIGEAPIGLQGTFSTWDSAAAVRAFAYKSSAHLAAIDQTKEFAWYAEELFARFAIIEESGSLQTHK